MSCHFQKLKACVSATVVSGQDSFILYLSDQYQQVHRNQWLWFKIIHPNIDSCNRRAFVSRPPREHHIIQIDCIRRELWFHRPTVLGIIHVISEVVQQKTSFKGCWMKCVDWNAEQKMTKAAVSNRDPKKNEWLFLMASRQETRKLR